MNTGIKRLWIGLLLGLPFAILGFATTQSVALAQSASQTEMGCETCHSAFMESWELSTHANAVDDPIFLAAWKDEGEPQTCLSCHTTGYDPETGTWESRGVGCEACHVPGEEDHPLGPMGVDRSSQLCGNCHTETNFAWEVSKHYQEDLTCINCHDPHATALKTASTSDLCASCHRTRAEDFTHSSHNRVGLTCTDCHLETLEGEAGQGKASRDHSFYVNLGACVGCHGNQLHEGDGNPIPQDSSAPLDSMSAVESAAVTLEANPVSPFGFAVLAGLVGMASGMILAPWLERFYRRFQREEE